MNSLFLAPLALAAACTDAAPIPEAKSALQRDTAPTADLTALVAGNTQFAVDVYHQLDTGTDNLFFSPHSISEALAMTLAGAAGDTAAQMTATLHAPADVHAGMNELELALASRGQNVTHTDRPFALHNADALWGEKTLPFEAPFLDTLAVNYGAGVYMQDYANDPDGAMDTINGWVAGETNDKIQNLLVPGDITTNTLFVLTNAIYFTASWADQFDAADTHDGVFTTPGSPVTASLMRHESELGYLKGDAYEAVALPYDGGDLEMLVISPDSLSAFEASMTATSLQAIASATQLSTVDLTMPKFKTTQRMSVKNTLQALGMVDAFSDEDADFSGIDGGRNIWLSDVIHKAFIAVDETGTEAAAATAVIGAGDAAPVNQVTVRLDHPFVFAIRDVQSGAILFFGRVTDPTNQ